MNATILCYHKVGPATEEGRRLNIEPRRFESHARFYARRRTPHYKAADLVRRPTHEAICFTFDDAYASALANARPILDRYGFKGTFYAVTDLIGRISIWDGEAGRPLASIEELKLAGEEGHEIGNHTANHLRLAELPPEVQSREILTARGRLLDEGMAPGSLCYPYGSYNSATLFAAREAGYDVAVSLIKGWVTPRSDPLALPRIVVAFSDTLPMLIYKTVLRPRMRRT